MSLLSPGRNSPGEQRESGGAGRPPCPGLRWWAFGDGPSVMPHPRRGLLNG